MFNLLLGRKRKSVSASTIADSSGTDKNQPALLLTDLAQEDDCCVSGGGDNPRFWIGSNKKSNRRESPSKPPWYLFPTEQQQERQKESQQPLKVMMTENCLVVIEDEISEGQCMTRGPEARAVDHGCQDIKLASSSSSAHEYSLVPPTAEQLKHCCWTCHTPLKVTGDRSAGSEICCYALHVHVLLRTPICSVCQDAVVAVVQEHAVDATWTEYLCAGCGAEEADTLFLCDNNEQVCNRAFCWNCVAKANGGGLQGIKQTISLQHANEPWKCPACEPTATLLAIRVPEEDQHVQREKRTLEDIVDELAIAEVKKKECLELLENEDTLRTDIRDELSSGGLTIHELENEVESETLLWRSEQLNHCARLDDFITSLQDELELNHQVHMADVYNNLLTLQSTSVDSSLDNDWVRQADEANDMRDARERRALLGAPVTTILPPSAYEEEHYVDVVELDSVIHSETEANITPDTRLGWRALTRPTKGQILLAKTEEDRRVAEMQVHIRSLKDAQDFGLTLEENQAASLDGLDGISRIRRDTSWFPERKNRTRKSGTDASLLVRQCSSAGADVSSPERFRSEVSAPSSSVRRKKRTKLSYMKNCLRGPYLSDTPERNQSSAVSLLTDPSKALKEHQLEGVRFIWRNTFSDIRLDDGISDNSVVGGCILAHNMVSLYCLETSFLMFVTANINIFWRNRVWERPLPRSQSCIQLLNKHR
jgi:hypothetical protein